MRKATPFPTKPRKQPRIAWVIAGASALAATGGCSPNTYQASNAPSSGYVTASNGYAYNGYYYTNVGDGVVTPTAYAPTRIIVSDADDCVHGSTGVDANLDCSRKHASRHTMDTSARHTDTAIANGSMRGYDVAWSNRPNPAYVYDYRTEVPYAYNDTSARTYSTTR